MAHHRAQSGISRTGLTLADLLGPQVAAAPQAPAFAAGSLSLSDLGGHSLLAAVLVARIAEQAGGKISLKDFLARPTVRGVAALLDEGQS